MASVNKKAGTTAYEERELSPFERLQRTIMGCILFEDNYYEDGITVIERITADMKLITRKEAVSLLYEAKVQNRLRSVPILILTLMAENHMLKAEDVYMVCDRVDMMAELMAMWNRDKKRPIPKQMKLGLQTCFTRFDEYQFGKYKLNNREWKTRDVLRLVRPKPENDKQAELWGKIIKEELAVPDTWEVELSKSTDKHASWERLLNENRLGALALLRNVRNMSNAGISRGAILDKLSTADMTRVLPYQIMACARENTFTEDVLNEQLLKSCSTMKHIPGNTLIMVDTSGSMDDPLSEKGTMKRIDAAKTMAIILREVCDNCFIFKFNDDAMEIPARRGFALGDAIGNADCGTDIYKSTSQALEKLKYNDLRVDRIVIITDEQDHRFWGSRFTESMNKVHAIFDKGYVMNIGVYQNGVGYQKGCKWTHISGFSENTVRFIAEMENKNER